MSGIRSRPETPSLTLHILLRITITYSLSDVLPSARLREVIATGYKFLLFSIHIKSSAPKRNDKYFRSCHGKALIGWLLPFFLRTARPARLFAGKKGSGHARLDGCRFEAAGSSHGFFLLSPILFKHALCSKVKGFRPHDLYWYTGSAFHQIYPNHNLKIIENWPGPGKQVPPAPILIFQKECCVHVQIIATIL